MGNGGLSTPRSGGFVCRECNRLISRGNRYAIASVYGRCDCGLELIAIRPPVLTFGVGVAWACIVMFGSVLAARAAPHLKETILNGGLAIGAALACNRALEASRHRNRPEPTASVARQTFAEAAGAIFALVIGSVILLR